jgi:hypothetical protein
MAKRYDFNPVELEPSIKVRRLDSADVGGSRSSAVVVLQLGRQTVSLGGTQRHRANTNLDF